MESLQTQRLVLRRPTYDDAAELAILGNNRRITDKLATMPYPYDISDAHFWIDGVNAMQKGAAFIIRLKDTEELVGCCGSGPVDDKDEIDFGYWIGESFWGNGFASEAGQAVLDHVFNIDRFDVITTDCQCDNQASLRVLEKLGFKQVGYRTRFSVSCGQLVETIKVQLSFNDWRLSAQQRLRLRS